MAMGTTGLFPGSGTGAIDPASLGLTCLEPDITFVYMQGACLRGFARSGELADSASSDKEKTMSIQTARRAIQAMLAAALLLAPMAAQPAQKEVSLLPDASLKGWHAVGDANWKVTKGVLEATTGSGYLMTDASYKNFELSLEIWVDGPANSGVMLRCQNPKEVGLENSYEVNIFDTRPDQSFATGSIVNVGAPKTPIKAANKWNKIQITANGPHLVVVFNGVKTVDGTDTKFAEGSLSLQRLAGVVRFRNVKLKVL